MTVTGVVWRGESMWECLEIHLLCRLTAPYQPLTTPQADLDDKVSRQTFELMWGQVMGKKSSFAPALCLLLMVALCFEAVIIDHILYYRHDEKTWTKARLHCENRHKDVFLENREASYCWFTRVMENWTQQVWIDLFRDPETMSAYEWITQRLVAC